MSENPISKIGIIAGGGSLPGRLIQSCEAQGLDYFLIGLDGHTDPALVEGREHMWTKLGRAGKVLNTLRAHDVKDIVLIGSVRRPSLSELVADLKTIEFFARVGMKAMGDNDFLSALRDLFEEEGFTLHGIQKFANDLLASEGLVGKYKPKKDDWIDIKRGVQMTQELGALDVGQAAIVQEGIVLGVEAAEGTDRLIHRCKDLKRKGRGGVLVKMCKPQQDRDLDLPTVGPDTIKYAAECGLSGVVIHTGQSLLLEPESVVKIANQHKIFVLGIDPLKIGGYS